MIQLQAPVPLSQSQLWALQQASYAEQGIAAWAADRTPSYLTSSPLFADAVADVIWGLLADERGGPPVQIVELGAGSGRFAYLLLRALAARRARCKSAFGPPAAAAPYRLVMTDSAPSLLRSWAENPQLRPFAAAGELAFARFDVSDPAPLRLEGSGEDPLGAGLCVVLAGYLWDSVPQDAYALEGGRIQALHIGLVTEEDPDGRSASEILADLRLLQRRAPAEGLDPSDRALLAEYASLADKAVVLLPTAARRCLAWLAAACRGGLVALSADKGFVDAAGAASCADLAVTIHGGTASLTVDFHALSRLVSALGGWSLAGAGSDPLFSQHLAVLGRSPDQISRCVLAFEQVFSANAGYDFYRLCAATAEEGLVPSPRRLLAMLALSRGDPDVVQSFAGAFRRRLPELDDAEKGALADALQAVGERTYYVAGDEDVDALLGELLAALERPAGALAALARSRERRGPTPEALRQAALCHSLLGQPAEALACIDAALALPGEEAAQAPLRQWQAALRLWAGGELP